MLFQLAQKNPSMYFLLQNIFKLAILLPQGSS